MPEVLLVKSDIDRDLEWVAAFAGFDIEVRPWNAPGDTADIDYALVWQPPPGALADLPNLKIIFSLGAGLDHLLGDGILPPRVPVVRMVEDTLTAGMVEFVVYQVLRFHRFMPQYEADQRTRTWRECPPPLAAERRVGILGLGALGGAAAAALVALGFSVAGWSRSPKQQPGVTSHHGEAQLPAFLAASEILICLLPLTDATRGILNARTFAHLPRGAVLVNVGRGAHCVETDLLEALDSGQLAAAALDVFPTEPLPPDSPLWRHPNIHITPHIASMTLPATSARHVIANITRHRNAEPLTHVADLQRGY